VKLFNSRKTTHVVLSHVPTGLKNGRNEHPSPGVIDDAWRNQLLRTPS